MGENMPYTTPSDGLPREHYFKKTPGEFKLQTPSDLLKKKNNHHYLRTLPHLANAPQSIYDAIYLPCIEYFAEYCQTLPAFHVNPYNFPGGLLELGIARGHTALSIYRKEEPITGIKPEAMSAKAALWTYAIFTAGLFYDVGYLASHFWITQCDKKGENGKTWHPFQGPMEKNHGHYFRYCYETEKRDPLRNRVSPLLARQMMSPIGFDWLSQDKDIFEYWLAILENDEEAARLMAKYVIPAEWQLIEAMKHQQSTSHKAGMAMFNEEGESETKKSFFEKFLEKANPFSTETPDKVPHLTSPFTRTTATDATHGRELGQRFLLWLRNGIVGHSISVTRTHEGILLISPAIFKEFVAAHPGSYSWEAVYKSFAALGYTDVLRGKQSLHQYHLGAHSKETIKGLLVKNKQVITWLYNGHELPSVNASIAPMEQSTHEVSYPHLVAKGHIPTSKNS